MSRKDQKEQEKKDIELFFSLSDINYDIFDLECEKPDCDIKVNQRNIGIEITEFVRSKEYCSKVRSVNTTLDRIRRETKSEIKEFTDISLTLNFSQHSTPPRRIRANDRLSITNFLVSHVKKQEIQTKLGKDLFHIEYKYSNDENEFIESVRVSSYPGKQTLDVTENKYFMTGVIPKVDIDDIIRDKESKIDFARNDETWLLMVVAETEYSSGIITPDVLEYQFDPCLFDRIFLLERFSKNLHELNKCI
jgi:hypothetical protein